MLLSTPYPRRLVERDYITLTNILSAPAPTPRPLSPPSQPHATPHPRPLLRLTRRWKLLRIDVESMLVSLPESSHPTLGTFLPYTE